MGRLELSPEKNIEVEKRSEYEISCEKGFWECYISKSNKIISTTLTGVLTEMLVILVILIKIESYMKS